MIKALLEEGIDPNTTDNMNRTALHYAVMRFELVQKEILLAAAATGQPVAQNIRQQTQSAQEKHPLVIEYLLHYANIPVDLKALNKAGNSAVMILSRDKKSGAEPDAVVAAACLARLDKVSEVKLATTGEETYSINPRL